MVRFILNNKLIHTESPPGMTILDFIRYDEGLKGTKIGCREGDCGACTVIEGELINNALNYKTIVSCLTPLGNINGKHIVTIEGVNMAAPSPIQDALIKNNGTQCGFCTPGFVISLTAFLLSDDNSYEKARAAIDGNICRCTGYKSIEHAAKEISDLKSKYKSENSLDYLVRKGFIPAYFQSIQERLSQIPDSNKNPKDAQIIVGGGTDLMIQKPDEVYEQELGILSGSGNNSEITIEENSCTIIGGATATDIMQSELLQDYFPNIQDHFKLISSTPIRNMGTLAGNIVNASPIGDLSIFFLALDANLILLDKVGAERIIRLRDFFVAYKKLKLKKDELIKSVVFQLPDKFTLFNFEKVSKRQFLDIASVNSAIKLKFKNQKIIDAHLSAGGVNPIPFYLKNASEFLLGKAIAPDTVIQVNEIAQKEILPISDIRGHKDYKSLLLRQLIFAHFIELFPDKIYLSDLLQKISHE